MAELEKAHILEVLHQTNWRIEGPKGAAVILGLHPNTLRSRMSKLALQRPAREKNNDLQRRSSKNGFDALKDTVSYLLSSMAHRDLTRTRKAPDGTLYQSGGVNFTRILDFSDGGFSGVTHSHSSSSVLPRAIALLLLRFSEVANQRVPDSHRAPSRLASREYSTNHRLGLFKASTSIGG